MRTLLNLRAEARLFVPDVEDHVYRNSEVDRSINRAYRKMVRQGRLLTKTYVTNGIEDQGEYDLTSSIIWMDTGTASGATINEGATFSSSDTTLTASDGTLFSANQLIKIDSEILRITAISTNDLTVTRGAAGTTAASHSDGTSILIGSTPDILELFRVDYDGDMQDPIAMHEIMDLSETFGAYWFVNGVNLTISPRSESLKEIKIHIVYAPTSLSSNSDTAATILEDYEEGLTYYAAFEKAEKHVALFDPKKDVDRITQYSGLRSLYKKKWLEVLEDCEQGGYQRIGVKFVRPNPVTF